MKHFLKLTAVVLLLATLLCACSNDPAPTGTFAPQHSANTTPGTTTAPDNTIPSTVPVEVTALQPILRVDADSIQYYNCSESGNFAVLQRNGKFGIMDYDGNIIVPIEYRKISQGYGFSYNGLWGTDANGKYFYVAKDGTIQYTEDGGGGGVEPVVYWYQDSYIWFTYESGIKPSDWVNWMPEISQKTWKKGCVLPVQELTGIRKEGWVTYPEVDNMEYGLLDMEANKMVTDFVYTKFDGHNGFQSGVLAVKKDGKWGFVDATGNAITDFIYEPYESYLSHGELHESIYSGVNGYITVKKDGLWGLLDTNGNTVLDMQYKGISQVNADGYVWVQIADTWALYQLDGSSPVALTPPDAATPIAGNSQNPTQTPSQEEATQPEQTGLYIGAYYSGSFSQIHKGKYFLSVEDIDYDAQRIKLEYTILFEDNTCLQDTKWIKIETQHNTQFFNIYYSWSGVKFMVQFIVDPSVGIYAYSDA